MPIVTLRNLYFDELDDLRDAEQQVLRELPLMAAGATAPELRGTFDDHYRRTQQHVERIEELFSRMDERPRSTPCRALRGIIEHARARNTGVDRGEVLDVALIGAAQRIGHYKIAAYSCARTFALTLADLDAAGILQQTLDEESAMDQDLVTLAERRIDQSRHIAAAALNSPRGSTPAWKGGQSRLTVAPGTRMDGPSAFPPPRTMLTRSDRD